VSKEDVRQPNIFQIVLKSLSIKLRVEAAVRVRAHVCDSRYSIRLEYSDKLLYRMVGVADRVNEIGHFACTFGYWVITAAANL
jgi:hypothetical protein